MAQGGEPKGLGMLIKKSYKKLKAQVYFDKSQLPLRDAIVRYEFEDGASLKIEDKLAGLVEKLETDDDMWEAYEKSLLDSIGVWAYPKALEGGDKRPDKDDIIFNTYKSPLKVKRGQYFIDLPVEGHILSVLWLMTIGRLIDTFETKPKGLYEHLYGNRLMRRHKQADGRTMGWCCRQTINYPRVYLT